MRKVLTVIAVIVLIVLIGAGVVQYFSDGDGPGITDDQAGPAEEVEEPLQPEWCPRVEFISAPGTWESAADDDPFHPQANPHSFLLGVTQPLQERYAPDDVRVWTLPYSAQFANVQNADALSYDESREEGTNKVRERLRETRAECPLTDFAMTGFSQGAVILGDIANEIGNHRGIIPPERVRGIALLADGRRTPDQGINPGVPVGGVGAEVSLQPLEGLVQNVAPGASCVDRAMVLVPYRIAHFNFAHRMIRSVLRPKAYLMVLDVHWNWPITITRTRVMEVMKK